MGVDNIDSCFLQAINGVSKIKDGYNPATWMLEVTTLSQEEILGVNFTEAYRNSDLYRYLDFKVTSQKIPSKGQQNGVVIISQ